jgi:vacuolar protein sorting-associated protein 26
VPIRLFLGGFDLTPTMKDINKKFSVRYFLNLVLVDEDDRRYFKQQEITLWRKADPKLVAALQARASGDGASATPIAQEVTAGEATDA